MNILIIGCGYVGERVAKLWLEQGHHVTALTRSAQHADAWHQQGIKPVVGDVLNVESLTALPVADLCLYAVGYDRQASPSKEQVYVQGLKNVLSEIAEQIPHVIYISSSSVYGQDNGEWVDENSATEPTSPGGEICLAAEQTLREFYPEDHSSRKATIVRCSGIYGPGRMLARQSQLENGEPFQGNPDAWLNLVHVDDIVHAVDVLARSDAQHPLYLLSDTQPISRRDFYTQLAKALNAPSPNFEVTDSESFNKRINSERIRNEFNLKMKHPTIESGLQTVAGK